MRTYRLEELAAATGQSARSVAGSVARGEIATILVGRRGRRIPEQEFRRLTGQPPREDERSTVVSDDEFRRLTVEPPREDERPTVLRGTRPSSRGGAR